MLAAASEAVSVKRRLQTADCRLQTWEKDLLYKMKYWRKFSLAISSEKPHWPILFFRFKSLGMRN